MADVGFYDPPVMRVMLAYDPRFIISETMNILELHAMSSVCRRFRPLFLQLIEDRVERFLCQYESLVLIQGALNATGAMISGNGVRLLLRCYWCPLSVARHPPLEIYCTDALVDELIHWFTVHSDYETKHVTAYNPNHPEWYKGRTAVTYRLTRKSAPASRITIRSTYDDSALSPILRLDSTSMMNVLTASSLYCLYPALHRERYGVNQYTGEIRPAVHVAGLLGHDN
ncbi:hypothetical protein SISNIDRAFT_485302 [Sistotremastrum niveocremeum HHB9708]|uniref:Uncharacterized protein n=1 Tax=Sistotremastrum niveocremeum HHB9708 TaxID=1314777 RepID=A0A164V026_9AGAM|nr:hypothetical protein SISNIDRAFT_485302 [Sistotremastrum niveocremeum HHB9708]